MESREYAVLYYEAVSGALPFRQWRATLSDQNVKAAVDARIARLRAGNFGNSRPIGEGVSENKIDFGPGYRIYYAVSGLGIILLCAGDKSTQRADILHAKAYWQDYKTRKRKSAKDKK
jgi:putative addiction module killer protein